MDTTNPKPCGCIPGNFDCPIAVRLWRLHNEAWYRKDWTAYDKTRAAYTKHKIKAVKVLEAAK